MENDIQQHGARIEELHRELKGKEEEIIASCHSGDDLRDSIARIRARIQQLTGENEYLTATNDKHLNNQA